MANQRPERDQPRPQADAVPHPPIVPRARWRVERLKLLEQEKALTRTYDRVAAERRRLPMVPVAQDYVFAGTSGQRSLLELFAGRRQLIIYHFMFDPKWEKGCPGCTGFINALGDLSLLAERDTTFAVISRAPLTKVQAYQAEKGWDIDWLSSFANTFNRDFHVTLDPAAGPIEYNYRSKAEMEAAKGHAVTLEGEAHGLSVFFRVDERVHHTYSAYARGCESVTDAYRLLDLTPYGRQQEFEKSPAGWPQRPTYG
ncbi:MAG: DUF899 domain-containing protein [Planctomycetes bacterium]|nr:DUF899 domain-containing protein [Planctomycetota bacterium]